jgi:RNA polymerase sigma factor (sigma-70 family)
MRETEPLVIVVDDDPSVRKSLERLMRSISLKVETFASADLFLETSVYDGPSCLVLDIRMPGLSGLDLQKKLKESDRSIPIIFISGHGDIPMSVRAMKDGAVDFLVKPVNDQDLIDAIHAALEKDRQMQKEQLESRELNQRLELMTKREREVFELVVKGKLNKQIAYDMGISEKTVKVHRGRVMHKMQADSLAELVRMAEKIGVFSAETD